MTQAADNLGYGTSADLCRLLDGVSVTLREEPQSHWDDDPDLREATKAVADHLYHRLGIRRATGTRRGNAVGSRRETPAVPGSPKAKSS